MVVGTHAKPTALWSCKDIAQSVTSSIQTNIRGEVSAMFLLLLETNRDIDNITGKLVVTKDQKRQRLL